MTRIVLSALFVALNVFPTMVGAETSSDGPSDRPTGRDCRTTISTGNQDRDGDGLSDGRECALGTSRLKADSDDDGLDDGVEVFLGTNPLDADTDGDLVEDLCEFGQWNKIVPPLDPRVADPDSDGDQIPDAWEFRWDLNPTDRDTDDDMLYDNEEWPQFGTCVGKNGGWFAARYPDRDGDGIDDGVEVKSLGTNPNKADTDGDQYGDWGEVYTYGTDPTDPTDHPNPVLYPPDHP